MPAPGYEHLIDKEDSLENIDFDKFEEGDDIDDFQLFSANINSESEQPKELSKLNNSESDDIDLESGDDSSEELSIRINLQ